MGLPAPQMPKLVPPPEDLELAARAKPDTAAGIPKSDGIHGPKCPFAYTLRTAVSAVGSACSALLLLRLPLRAPSSYPQNPSRIQRCTTYTWSSVAHVLV